MTEVLISAAEAKTPVPIHLVTTQGCAATLDAAGPAVRALAALQEFSGKTGQVLLAPNAAGGAESVLFGVGEALTLGGLRALPARLPAGDYTVTGGQSADRRIATAWALGSYRFDRYKASHPGAKARLAVGDGVDLDEVRAMAHACALARDMINTPANDMGPLQIETIAREIAHAFGAEITVTTGEALHDANYPAVHAVGRAAAPGREGRMIEMSWAGPKASKAPLIALVGKGVVFDTGGLDLKPSAGMRLMKKDMGGAAHALALGRMIMAAQLPVRLTVLLPVVENAVSGDAMRPGDVIATRKGLSVEIGNTDAEGRLILADALTRAAELEPALTIDIATLTGAARAALGPQLPPFFTEDEALAEDLSRACAAECDPVWRLPLWAPYAEALDSDIADLKNDPDGWAQAGAVTAALFLKRFAPAGSWLHLDIFAWNPKNRPGWPVGGEAQGVRALFHLLKARYA